MALSSFANCYILLHQLFLIPVSITSTSALKYRPFSHNLSFHLLESTPLITLSGCFLRLLNPSWVSILIMAPSSCCISRCPPSPDGLAPRPAPCPQISDQGKDPEPKLQSFAAASYLSRPEDIVDLQAIFESDKSSTTSV